MDRLPQETINRIVSYVGVRVGAEHVKPWKVKTLPLARPPLAALSRRFQAAVEGLTFRMLHIKSTEITDLERMFDRYPARGQALKSVSISLVLPQSGQRQQDDECANDDDRAAKNASVTAELEHMFNLLAKWCGDKPCVDLEISDVCSAAGDAGQSSEPKHRFSLVKLVNKGSSLPPLPCVRSFVIRHGSSAPWHPAAVAALTSRMTHAEHDDWQLGWNEAKLWGRYYAMDLQWREALVRAVLEGPPIVAPSATDFGDEPLAEISIQMPPGYGSTEQELGGALVFYEDHMGQDRDDDDGGGDDDGHVRPPRDTPADAQLNPLLASFARACARLPSLEVASLEAEYKNDENWPFVLTVAAPGKILGGNWGDKFTRGHGTWRWYLHVEGQWRPDRETMDI